MIKFKIIDTPWHTTTILSCLKTEGIETVIRYYNNGNGKNLYQKRLEVAEANALSTKGFNIMVIFQLFNNAPKYFDFDQGLAAGKSAFLWARDTIGQPFNSAIYFAIDYDAMGADITTKIIPYFEGVQQAFDDHQENGKTYKVGAYGSGAVMTALLSKQLISYRWLSESTGYAGTKEAIRDGDYELYQKLRNPQSICGIDADFDIQNPDMNDMGSFRLQSSV